MCHSPKRGSVHCLNKQLGGRFRLMIILENEESFIGCVGVARSWWIICWFIVILLMHCGTMFFCLFGAIWVMLRRAFDLLVGWGKWFGKCLFAVWNVVSLCLIWL